MVENYTLLDILGILRVLPFFGLVLFAPGYLLGLAGNVLAFRTRGTAEKILLSLTLSCAVSPYVINLLCRFLTVRVLSWFFLVLGTTCLATVLAQWRKNRFTLGSRMHWTTRTAIGMAALWLLVCLTSLPDLQLGKSIYSTAATFDHSVRSAFIASALRSGAPPDNPFFYPGFPVHARYFYYWNVMCAIPAQISGANPRVTLYASCFWSGLCLASIIPLYLKHFLETKTRLRLKTVIAFGLLSITGLDLIPTFVIWLFHTVPPGADMDWWDTMRVHSWIDSLLWVPHHVASLVVCLTGFLLLWKAVNSKGPRSRILPLSIAVLAFSTGAGLSIYVTVTFALFVLAWLAHLLIRGRIIAAILHFAVGLTAIVLSIGYLADLLGRAGTQNAGVTSFIAFSLCPLPALFAPFPAVFGRGNVFVAAVVYALLLVLTLFLELGVYFAAGNSQFKQDWSRRRDLSEAQRCLWFMTSTTLFVIIFLRSTVIGANDLAWRGCMLLQFVLLLWAAVNIGNRVTSQNGNSSGISKFRLDLSKAMFVLILIGGASSLYQLFMLRTYKILSEKYGWEDGMMLASGPEAFAIRDAYARLDRSIPLNAIVQYNPESKVAIQLNVDSHYQAVDAFDPGCGTVFGGSLQQCQIVEAQLGRIFNPDPGVKLTKSDVSQICRSLRIDTLIVIARDPIWSQTGSWVWQATPSIANDFVRIYRCEAFPET
jgi:hypothetical protein